ncbi:M56 family metallopeptidase [Mucilaginibacter sp. CSA2-8R]|uniref:M56 family metallopeptidase n=1 Tax=Mucilaginibacter sp. CSA2-8R TaxID=3141542 RepID=UPI00315DEE75
MMMNGLTYLLEANIYLAAAYSAYWLLLRKQTFYRANRAYLLLSIAVSFAIPLVQLELPSNRAESTLAPVQQKYFAASNVNPAMALADKHPVLALNRALEASFITGVTVLLIFLTLKLYSLLKLISTHQHQKRPGYTLIFVPGLPSPFSFLGYLFAANEDDLTSAILRHELVHIGQKHSWDILFLELVKTISWFNPVVYLLQDSLKALHEYEADFESTARGTHPDDYVQILIEKACQVSGLPFANHFSNKQLLKSRIMKLYQKRSDKLARLTYLITLPLCAGMLCASTMAFSKNYGLLKLKIGTVLNPETTSTLIANENQPDKKQRLKITSGNMTTVTEKLTVGVKDETLTLTVDNLTTENKKMLAKLGVKVATTDAAATIKSLTLPPPPPPATGNRVMLSKYKTPHPVLPSPLSALPQKSTKTNKMQAPLMDHRDTVDQSQFKEMFKQVARTTRYPIISREKGANGMVVATFRVTQDKKISNIKIKKGISPELDAEAARSIAAYKGTVSVTSGNYSLGIYYVVDYGDGTTNYRPITESEKPTAGIITVVSYGDKKQ